MKGIVVTGATSMLGVSLIEECLSRNVRVLAIVRRNCANLDRLPHSALMEVAECNLDELDNFCPAIQDQKKYDIFYHFGWSFTDRSGRYDAVCQERNIGYSIQAVKLAARLGCNTFIGAGSQAEYGRVSDLIGPATAVHPENAYGIAKYAAGRLCGILCREMGIKYIWTRIFSVFGPYDHHDTMVMYAVRSLLKREKPVFTRAEQEWDYLYSRDAARAFYMIGESGRDQSVYCIGSGKMRKLYEYIEIIRKEIDPGLPVGIGEKEYSPNQIMHLCADIENLVRDTGFQVQYSFEEGIRETVDWYQRNLERENGVHGAGERL